MSDGAFSQTDLRRIESVIGAQALAHYRAIPSTNDRALELAKNPDLPVPFLVLADRQTAGRGRGANRWWSTDGALTFSYVTDLAALGVLPERWPQASLAAALAVRASLAAAAPEAAFSLKWPNDVLLEHRKVSGILAEIAPHAPKWMVIGIGINVNNSFAKAPAELQHSATSLRDATGRSFDRTSILITLLAELETRLRLLREDQPALIKEWRQHCVLAGQTIDLRARSQVVTGLCCGIDDDGALLVKTPSGTERYLAGVIDRVRPADDCK